METCLKSPTAFENFSRDVLIYFYHLVSVMW